MHQQFHEIFCTFEKKNLFAIGFATKLSKYLKIHDLEKKTLYEFTIQGVLALVRILLLRVFKTITIILLMRFYGLFILLVRSLAKDLANAIFGEFFQVPKVALGKNPL